MTNHTTTIEFESKKKWAQPWKRNGFYSRFIQPLPLMTNLLALDEIDIVFMVGLLSIKFPESEHELADYGGLKDNR